MHPLVSTSRTSHRCRPPPLEADRPCRAGPGGSRLVLAMRLNDDSAPVALHAAHTTETCPSRPAATSRFAPRSLFGPEIRTGSDQWPSVRTDAKMRPPRSDPFGARRCHTAAVVRPPQPTATCGPTSRSCAETVSRGPTDGTDDGVARSVRTGSRSVAGVPSETASAAAATQPETDADTATRMPSPHSARPSVCLRGRGRTTASNGPLSVTRNSLTAESGCGP